MEWPLRDPTSPAFALSSSIGGELLTLVFSDEFNETIKPGGYNTTTTPAGRQEKWSATANLDTDAQGQTFLDPGQVQAANGTLIVTGQHGTVSGSQWLGGQLSSWNRVCFQVCAVHAQCTHSARNVHTVHTRRMHSAHAARVSRRCR